MRRFVRRDVVFDIGLRDFALGLLRGVRGHDHGGEIKRLFEYVRDEITYRKHPVDVQLVPDARRTLARGVGDCVGKSVLLCSLLGSVGHVTRFRTLSQFPPFFNHINPEVDTPRGWVPLDPTPPSAPVGWQAEGLISCVHSIF